MGLIIPPATEADRCRLAVYFRELEKGNRSLLGWTHRWAAADLVKRVVIAAEQGVMLINTSFIEDLARQRKKPWRGGAGISAWSGMVDLREQVRRPAFFALEQVTGHLHRYRDIQRVKADDDDLRIYRVARAAGPLWIAWVEPGQLCLPGDPRPKAEIDLPVEVSHVMVERLVMRPQDVHHTRRVVTVSKGVVTVTLSPTPVYIYASY